MVMLRRQVLLGDALARLGGLADESVDCVITSPPYFALRNYGVDGQLGQEPDVDGWVDGLRTICRELHRVLAPHGSLWLNLGDSYSRHQRFGAPPKSLLLGPERLALLLLRDGWLLRNKVVWSKSNPLPSPVGDRLTNAHEVVYFFVKRPNYFFDLDAIREPVDQRPKSSAGGALPASALGVLAGRTEGLAIMAREGRSSHLLGKNPTDVWRLGSASFRGAHFATFPPELIRRPLLGTCPPRVCTGCARPWRRSTRRVVIEAGQAQRRPFEPCGCGKPTRPGLVLDPFFGTGTVGAMAERYDRDWLGIELNHDYIPLAEHRLGHKIRRSR